MKRAAALCLLLILPVAIVGAQSPTPQTAVPSIDSYPEPGAAPIVKLLAAGETPRRALRFVIPPSYKQHFDMSTEMAVAMEMAGTAVPAVNSPAVTLGCDIAVSDVAANGDISYTMKFTGASVAPGGAPAVAQALQSLDTEVKGISGTVTVNNRGLTRAMKIDLAKGATPEMSQVMDQFSSQAHSLSIPLPEEEVGTGARWEARFSMNNSGMRLLQRVEYELVALDGNAATLKVKMEQTARPQSFVNPALPPGVDAQLLSLSTVGAGTSMLRFDSLIPNGTVNADSKTEMKLSMGGEAQVMTMKMSMKMSVAAK